MKWFVLLFVCGVLAIFVLPLRFISEWDYIAPSKPLAQGHLSIAFDPHYYPARKWFGLHGLEGRSPYRVRVVFAPHSWGVEQFEVRGLAIEGFGRSEKLPARVAAGPVRNADGQPMFIVGYLDVPLDAETLAINMVVVIDGLEQPCSFEAKKVSNQRIIHAGVEALEGL